MGNGSEPSDSTKRRWSPGISQVVPTYARADPRNRRRQFLLPLSSPLGPFVDFLTPAAGALGLEAGLDSVLSTPRGSIRKDVAVLSGARHLPSWTGALADADVGTLRLVTSAMRSWHETAVVPYRAQIRAHVDAETAAHARLLRHGGIERVLQSLPAPLRWQAPVRTA